MTPAHAGVSGYLAQAGSAAGFLIAQWGLEVSVQYSATSRMVFMEVESTKKPQFLVPAFSCTSLNEPSLSLLK